MSAVAIDPKPQARSAHFLHLTDLHFSQAVWNPLRLLNKRLIGNANLLLHRRHAFMTEQAPAFLEYIAGLGVRDVLITGDLSTTSTDEEFAMGRDFVRELVRRGMSPRVIAGNHDVYTFESVRARRFEKYFREWMPAGTLPATYPLGSELPVLYVPTACANLLSSKGRIHPVEVELAGAMLKAMSGTAIIAGHYPVLPQTHAYATNANRRLRNADALAAALRAHSGPLLYLSGHVHRFSMAQDPQRATLTHLTSGALFRRDEAGHTGEFSEVRATAQGFAVRRHRFAGRWLVTEEIPRALGA